MEKRLIAGNSNEILCGMKAQMQDDWRLKRVAVFFENANFLITKYQPMTNGVYLVLELENSMEIHVEGANCGYRGSGPHATVSVLKMFGLEEKILKSLIFEHDAVQFEVAENKILWNTVDTSYLFYPSIRQDGSKGKLNKIQTDRNIDINLEAKKIRIYNPQRNCFKGMINLLSYMEDMEFEYYIGNDSPLDGGWHLERKFNQILYQGVDRPDVLGVEQASLVLHGTNFTVVCCVDKNYEKTFIETVYLILTGEKLVEDLETYEGKMNLVGAYKKMLKTVEQRHEMYGMKKIDQMHNKRGR